MVLTKAWLLATIPAAIVAVILLSMTAMSLLRTVRRSVLMSVPLIDQQTVTFQESGTFVLNVEGKSMSRVASGLNFAIAKVDGLSAIPMHRILVRTKVSSFSRTRLGLYGFEITAPGAYALRVTGIDSNLQSDDPEIVFTRPFGIALVLHVLALVALGALFIGSLVVTGLVFSK